MNKLDRILIQIKFQTDRNWIQMRRLLIETIAEYPEDKRLLVALGKLYERQKLYKKAIDAFQRAVQLDQNDEILHIHIGNGYLFLGEYRLAIDSFDRVQSDSPDVLYNKAFAYARLNKPLVTIEILERLIKLKPTTSAPYFLLCDMLYYQKNYEEILRTMNTVQRNFGPSSLVFYFTGVAYYHQNKYLNSFVELQKAEEFNMDHSHFYLIYAKVCNKIGKTDKAIELLKNSISKYPKDPTAYYDLAQMYLKLNRLADVESLINLAKKFLPHSLAVSLLHNKINRLKTF
ncbi:MAG: tetratricopeptide repeat protein [Candidatus Cloacimonetes bacterium]|nr:tetratricopeptide repeat protein [Candidatus Cloacimonadota bacterium]